MRFVLVLALLLTTAICLPQGYALRFTKERQSVVVPDHDALDITGDLTVEAWIRPEQAPNEFRFIVSKNFSGTGYSLLTSGEQRISFESHDPVNFTSDD